VLQGAAPIGLAAQSDGIGAHGRAPLAGAAGIGAP
jgi:hypothetical protein